jgi:hypothetical protein
MSSPLEKQAKQLEDEIFEKMTELRKLKNENPKLKRGYTWHAGGILNAYRECDISFEDAVEAMSKLNK